MSETTQGVIDCIKKKMYDLDAISFVSSWLPEALVHHCGLVGRPRLSINLVQIEFLRAWHFSWTRIAFTLCISRSTLWRRIKEKCSDWLNICAVTDWETKLIENVPTDWKFVSNWLRNRTDWKMFQLIEYLCLTDWETEMIEKYFDWLNICVYLSLKTELIEKEFPTDWIFVTTWLRNETDRKMFQLIAKLNWTEIITLLQLIDYLRPSDWESELIENC